ncbi:MAG: cytochrome c oxidase accessory protein CcoG [Gammaproteobacteria bacterium]|nr:MAG: cytochrome c oxidase accessory protein CcoG [Gammaproteobacteria bacterium]
MTDRIPAKDQTIKSEKREDTEQPKSVELYASRKKIYVKEVLGFFQKIRSVSLWLLMGLYFSLCWISINGEPILHFDLPERKFHIFGTTFWPQDFVLLSWSLIICAFGLFFVTTLFGRVWCGYTCPQTAWTFIFMWLEERIEGSRNQRIKLDKAAIDSNKIRKKLLKHLSWIVISLATGLTFVGYFYPIRELVVDLVTFNVANGWALFWIVFFTVATYLNAGWMREQICLYVCPYARFQSAMFDQDTMIVSYNPNRGETRGRRKKNVDPKAVGLGDCIDCSLCVQVCPTGIDIRDGLQYECIGCALCIDACDQVMEKMQYPKGLISYTTEKALQGKKSHILRPKSVGYLVAISVMVFAITYSISTRIPLELDVIRDRGSLYQFTGSGLIENTYTLKIMNMADFERAFQARVTGPEGIRISTRREIVVDSGEVASLPVSVEVGPGALTQTRTDILFTVIAKDDREVIADSESRFLGPPALR